MTYAISHNSLRAVAGLVWFSGAIVLALKGGSLLSQALELRAGHAVTWLAIPAALLIGGIKTKLIFGKACLKNLERIAGLEEPRIWDAYRPGFYVFLAAMVALGTTLSRFAAGNYHGLMAMTVLDFSLATALLGGGRHFWLCARDRPPP